MSRPKQRQPRELLNRICGHIWMAWYDHTLTDSQRQAVRGAFEEADDLHYVLPPDPNEPDPRTTPRPVRR